MSQNTVTNPLTKRQIAIGSVVYNKLVKKGVIADVTGQQQQQPQPKYTPIQPPKPMVSKAYAGLRGQAQPQYQQPQYQQPQYQPQPQYQQECQPQYYQQQPQKVKLPPEQKINNIIKSSAKAYKNTIQKVDPEQFDNEDELTNYIAEELVKSLKSSGNKHLQKYL
jgi:hypothetical protein